MYRSRKDELMEAIKDVAEGNARRKAGSSVEVEAGEVKVYKDSATMDIIVDLLYFKIQSESPEDANMDVKIAACMSRIQNSSFATIEKVSELAEEIICSALKGLDLHLDPESSGVEDGLKIQVVNKIKLLALNYGCPA